MRAGVDVPRQADRSAISIPVSSHHTGLIIDETGKLLRHELMVHTDLHNQSELHLN